MSRSCSSTTDAHCWPGKLSPPSSLFTTVRRQALLSDLHAHRHSPLTLMVAPAGYGKTTALMQWRESLLEAAPDAPVAWISLDSADAEPGRFVSCIILALDQAGVDLGQLSQLAKTQTLDSQPIRTLRALQEALAQPAQPVTLLMDDYHCATNQATDLLVGALLEQSVEQLQLVITSRTRATWPLARWKSQGWAHEISAYQLRLSSAETSSVLGPEWTPGEAQALHATTEGWPGAVQLARLWRQSHEGGRFALTQFSGRVSDMAHYMSEQIIATLPAHLRDFLLDTALLERFNADMADAVRGRQDSARHLAGLSHLDNLLVPLDAERRWFRYHGLLRDYLLQQMDAPRAKHIHRCAAEHLAALTDWRQAVLHALLAHDNELAVSMLVRAGGWALVLRHGIRFAQALVEQFDPETQRKYPDVLLVRAYLHAKQGDHALANQLLNLTGQSVGDDPRLQRDYKVVQAIAAAYCDRVSPITDDLASLYQDGAEDHYDGLAQATFQCVQALNELTCGNLRGALKIVRQAQVTMRLEDCRRGENYCRLHEARLLGSLGAVGESRQLTEQALAFADTHFGNGSSLKALDGCLKAQHLYWQGDWADALPWLKDGWAALEHADAWPDIVIVTAEVTWRIALQAQGMRVALAELDRVGRLAHQRKWKRMGELVYIWRVDLLVQCGQLAQARKAAVAIDLENTAHNSRDWQHQVAATLALGRLQMAIGASATAATCLMRTSHELEQRSLLLPAWRVRLLALAAQHKSGDTPCPTDIDLALSPLTEHSLNGLLLEVGPCLLPFIDRSADLFANLKPIITRLREWRGHTARPKAPLTPKEAKIVALLASGQSNKEIANVLDVSANTVKFHLRHIYHKLEVSNRTAAISVAMRQGLIDNGV